MAGYISMDSVSDIKMNGVDVEKITQGLNTLWEKNVIEPFNVKNISQSVATVDWNTGADNRNLEYSEDKTTWTSVPYADGKYTLTIPVGKKYYVQGNSRNFGGWWGSDQDVEISGYVLSLHYPTMEQPSNQGVSYPHLFSKNKNGTADSKLHFNFARLKLPVRRCNGYAYDCAFKGCLSITELKYDIFYTDSTITTDQNNFQNMFQNCTNLRRVDGFTFARFTNFGAWSELNGTFQGCTSLEYVWDGLFDTTVTPSTSYYRDVTCTNMFSDCRSLVHPPKLPAVRGSNTFGNMFANCISLTNETTQRILPNYDGIGTQGGEYACGAKFKGMFYGCTGLTSMHDLSSYTMGSYGSFYFYQMYYGCTGITSIDAAKMPGGVATANCFREMFRGCTGITSVPSGFIKPTNTEESCYQEMFRDCTGLTTIPSDLLPSTTLSKSCYAYMFYGCNHLTAIPSGFMSPTTVAEGCCQSMFENCSALTTIPSGLLPALTMAKNCYHSMFRSCTVLANVPYDLLPATTVAEGCYTLMFQYSYHGFTGLHLGATDIGTTAFANWMFFDCPISQLDVDFKEWTSATTEWVLRTSNRGTFTKYEALPEIYDISHIPVGWTVVNKYASESPTITHDASNVIIVNNTYNSGGVIYYTTDGSTPTNASSVYSQPFPAVLGQTIKAICIYRNIVSDVASWTVAATQLPAPTISGKASGVVITNNDATGDSTVYYTTDGSTPTSSSTLYTAPFSVAVETTVKAICIATSGILFTPSDVADKTMYEYTSLDFIHNETMSQDASSSYAINTGVTFDETVKFRYKGQFAYHQGGIVVGVDDNIRWFMTGNSLYYDYGERDNAAFDFITPPMLDLTVGNKYTYDNNTGRYLFNVTPRSGGSGNIIVDCTSFKLHSLEIWKTINNVETLVFSGHAAYLNGEYGLFDEVSKTLLGNSNITIVGEPMQYLYFEDRSGAANTITCTKTGDQAEWLSLEYSTDRETWSTYDLTQPLTIPANGRVYLRGSNTIGFGKDNSNYHSFTCSGNYALGGDLFSIMDGSLFAYPSRFATKTFYQSTTLVDISQLDFGSKKILATDFIQMFGECTSLVSLPNTIEVSYASTIDFSTHTSQFTQMFQYDPIANFPTFPNINTIGRDGMYCMNQSLDASPNTSLEFVDLSNITTLYYRGLRRAFRNASNLEVVKIGISAWPDFVDSAASDYNATSEWLYNVHSTGVFCKNSTLPVMRGDNYIPNNWSIADLNGKLYAPVITDNNGVVTIAEGGGGSSCSIYYTTDNTTPDTTSTLYTQPFARPANSVIKAIAVYSGNLASLVTNSDVAADYPITEMKFVRNTSMEANAASSKAITLLNTIQGDLEFRYKGQYAYDQSNGIVFTTGLIGNVGKHLWYMSGDKVYYKVGGGVKKQVNYNYKNVDMLDLTAIFSIFNDNYTYDNNTQTYVYRDASGGMMNGKLNIDVTSFKLHSIQIWDKNNRVLLFDGVAAMYNGQYGIYDKVSATLKTNSSITMVGEPYVQQV